MNFILVWSKLYSFLLTEISCILRSVKWHVSEMWL